MATLDFSTVSVANRTLSGSTGTSHTLTINPKAAAVYYRDSVGGSFKDASGTNVPYDADTWTRVWGRDPGSKLTVPSDSITITPASTAVPYARQE